MPQGWDRSPVTGTTRIRWTSAVYSTTGPSGGGTGGMKSRLCAETEPAARRHDNESAITRGQA